MAARRTAVRPPLPGKRRQTARRGRRGVLRLRRSDRREPARSLWFYDLLVPASAAGVRGAGPAGLLLLVGRRHSTVRRFASALEALALAVVRRVRGRGSRAVPPLRPSCRGADRVVHRRLA